MVLTYRLSGYWPNFIHIGMGRIITAIINYAGLKSLASVRHFPLSLFTIQECLKQGYLIRIAVKSQNILPPLLVLKWYFCSL